MYHKGNLKANLLYFWILQGSERSITFQVGDKMSYIVRRDWINLIYKDITKKKLVLVSHAYNSRVLKGWSKRKKSLEPAWTIERVQAQFNKTLF